MTLTATPDLIKRIRDSEADHRYWKAFADVHTDVADKISGTWADGLADELSSLPTGKHADYLADEVDRLLAITGDRLAAKLSYGEAQTQRLLSVQRCFELIQSAADVGVSGYEELLAKSYRQRAEMAREWARRAEGRVEL